MAWSRYPETPAGDNVTVGVEGLSQVEPTAKFVSAPTTLRIARDTIDRTAIYWWASSQGNIMSQTFGTPSGPSPVTDDWPSCPPVSRPGPKAPFPPRSPRTTGDPAARANWLTNTDDGAGFLVARVMANRLWYHHFGEGLVRTPSDFGTQGDTPALPELLDWLASYLIEHKWSLKEMHRLIVMSAVYQQNTTHDASRSAIDPENRLWWKRRPVRLEAEILRDSMLAVSGRLVLEMGGPGDFQPVPPEAILSRLGQAYPKKIADVTPLPYPGVNLLQAKPA